MQIRSNMRVDCERGIKEGGAFCEGEDGGEEEGLKEWKEVLSLSGGRPGFILHAQSVR